MRDQMKKAAFALIACSCAWPMGRAVAAGSPFDGRWNVLLVCDDTTDRKGLVKGYEYNFAVTIADGVLQGEYGAPGRPASVVYSGQVGADGTLEVQANGNTGKSDFSVGKVARGTQYSYTLRGKLEPTRGQASRIEVRPCTASFSKQ